MMIFRVLFRLLLLTSSNVLGLGATQTAAEPTIEIEKFEYHINRCSCDVLARGELLGQVTQGATPKVTVEILDKEMENILTSVLGDEKEVEDNIVYKARIETQTCWILQIFSSFYLTSGLYGDLHKVAQEENKVNFLKASIAFNHYESIEEFFPFLIASYKSSWYHKDFWNVYEINWSKVKLSIILKANNPKFLHDFLDNRLSFTTHHRLSNDKVLDLMAEYDLLDLYEVLEFATPVELRKRLDMLIEFGSFKLLKAFHEITGKKLDLWKRPFPTRFPKDKETWRFLMKQGYQYFSIVKLLQAACKGGYLYILEDFYAMDKTFVPSLSDIKLAAERRHWNIPEWAIKNGIASEMKGEKERESFLHLAILGEHFEIINFDTQTEQSFPHLFALLKTTPITNDLAQVLSNEAAKGKKLKAVKWLHEKFNVRPYYSFMSPKDTIEILKLLGLLELLDPNEVFAHPLVVLACSTDKTSDLKWLWDNYRRLTTKEIFTDDVKRYQANNANTGEKLRWIYKNWGILPTGPIDWDISLEDLRFFRMEIINRKLRIAKKVLRMAIINEDCGKFGFFEKHCLFLFDKVLIKLAREHGLTELEFDASKTDDIVEASALRQQEENEDILPPLLNRYYQLMAIDASVYGAVYNDDVTPNNRDANSLEAIKRKFSLYGRDSSEVLSLVRQSIYENRADVIQWMIEEGIIEAERFGDYLTSAILGDSLETFKIIYGKFDNLELPGDFVMECWKTKSLRIFKTLLPDLGNGYINLLLQQDVDVNNYHLRIILKDECMDRIKEMQ